MTEPAASLVGSVLQDAYQVTRLIGQGAMGAVYEATQTRLHKRVAIKVMERNLAANTEALARFRREIQVTAQLAHPNIIQVSDFGTAPTGEPFLVMEYLDGEDLEQRLQRVTRLPLASVVPIVKQLASALAVTHAEGIVHRDLKPANVFLVKVPGQTDFVKVVDFGISKVLKASTTKLTRAQMIVGTPEYMSPEQAAGKVDEIDHRSDQWSLSCITWHMLVGRQPFFGPDVNTVLHQVMNGEPPPLSSKLAKLLPGQVEQVLRRALSKRQQDRFPTITAFARAFEAAAPPQQGAPASEPQAPAPEPPPSPRAEPAARPPRAPSGPARRQRRPLVWIFATALAAALGIGAALLFQVRRLPLGPTATPARTSAATESGGGPTVVPLHSTRPGGSKAAEQKRRRAAQDR
jgi:eukaryotic-like serine/threonine-protein kinase